MNSNFNILALLNMYGNNLHDMSNAPIVNKNHEKNQFSQMALLLVFLQGGGSSDYWRIKSAERKVQDNSCYGMHTERRDQSNFQTRDTLTFTVPNLGNKEVLYQKYLHSLFKLPVTFFFSMIVFKC